MNRPLLAKVQYILGLSLAQLFQLPLEYFVVAIMNYMKHSSYFCLCHESGDFLLTPVKDVQCVWMWQCFDGRGTHIKQWKGLARVLL